MRKRAARVRRDLFDDEGGGYLQDAALLDRLVQQKLEALAEPVRAEGWSWTEAHADFGHDVRGRFRRRTPDEVPLPEAEAAELAALEAEYDELQETQYDEDGEEDAVVTARLGEIEERVEALNDRPPVWTPELMAIAGAVVYLSPDGEAGVERGLIRPEDEAGDSEADEDTPDAEAPSPAPSLPATLIADLTAQKTAAIRATLAQQPDVALAAVTHALARRAFYSHGGDTCLDITAGSVRSPRFSR